MSAQALKLAERDVAVFPCGADKRPLTKNGFKDASVDPAQVEEWWRQYPDALVGVPTGEKFVVVDCDLQHREALGWYFDHAVRLITRKHSTRSGGKHLLFRPDDRVACSAGKIHPHIDTRGKGGSGERKDDQELALARRHLRTDPALAGLIAEIFRF